MKRNTSLLILAIIISLFSCKKDTFRNSMSISEFYNYTNAYNTPCTGKLNHDGEKVALTGYIAKINTWSDDNRFTIYENVTISSADLEVHVIKHSDKIFDKILKELSNSDFVKISVCGNISGTPLPDMGYCRMGAFVDIDNDLDIRFE